jgi:hypothetical protein
MTGRMINEIKEDTNKHKSIQREDKELNEIERQCRI